MRRLISIVTPCYNEEGSIQELYGQIRDVMGSLPQYDYEHIIIDNASQDGTPSILRDIARLDRRVKVIFNVRNFGHIRSPYYGLLQSRGDAAIIMASDLQDPPALIPDFLEKWESGYEVVLGVKTRAEEHGTMFAIRRLYYRLVARLSDVRQVQNSTGFGLYDRNVVNIMRELHDPYPYFRGLVAELGFEPALIEYHQPARKSGITKNNFYSLYDLAMLGITSHSKVPLRLATMTGFAASIASLLAGIVYLAYKLLNWSSFSVGVAPLVIGLFFISSVQLFFLGILGEYIGAIHTQVLGRPLVVERERLNFDQDEPEPSEAEVAI